MIVEEFQENLKVEIHFSHQYPREQRSCRDTLCLIPLVLLFAFFFAFGIFTIYQGIYSYNHYSIKQQTQHDEIKYIIIRFIAIVFSTAALGIILVLFFFIIARKYPKGVLFFTLIGVTLILSALIIYCFVNKHNVIATISILCLLLYIISLFCSFRHHSKFAFAIAKQGSIFLKQSKNILSIPFVVGCFGILFSFILIGFYAAMIQLHSKNIYSDESTAILLGIMSVVYLFFVVFFYYLVVFLISSSVLFWYFNTEVIGNCIGMKWLVKYHLGSITYATFVLPIISILSFCVDLIQSKNCLSKCLNCIIQGCFINFKYLSHTLNHYSISLICMTGQNLSTSAQNSAILYYDNPVLHSVIKKLRFFLLTSGLFLCLSIPTFIGVIISSNLKITEIGNIVGITIILSTSLIVLIYITTFVQGISTAFTYYCLDRQFEKYNVYLSHVDRNIKQVYERLYQELKPLNACEGEEGDFDNIGKYY